MCALLTELAESKKQHSECQDEVKTTAASLFKQIFFLFLLMIYITITRIKRFTSLHRVNLVSNMIFI